MNDIKNIAQKVYSNLGYGYSESVYHNAMEVELRAHGIPYETERIIPIEYEGHVIGNLRADLIIDKKTIVELKSTRGLNEAARIQARQYMQLLGLPEAVLINFGLELQVEELVWRCAATAKEQSETTITTSA
jgi:GxxExxY protein